MLKHSVYIHPSQKNWFETAIDLNPAVYPFLRHKYNPSIENVTIDIPTSITKESVIKLSESVKYSAVLMGHCLSALGDSVFILADLGRGLRLAACLGLEKAVVYLAGPRWSALNKGFAHHFSDPHCLAANLDQNTWFRQKLYISSGIPIEMFDFTKHWCKAINLDELNAITTRLDTIKNHLLSEFDLNKLRNNKPLAREVIRKLSLASKTSLPTCENEAILESLLTAHPSVPSIFINLVRYFSTLDTETLRYFYTQKLVQQSYLEAGYVKVAPESEWRFFDNPFYGKQEGISGLYFPHYRIADERILPYNISALEFKTKSIDTLRQRVPMLTRGLKLEDLREAYTNLIGKNTLWARIFVSDILSYFVFSQMLSDEDLFSLVDGIDAIWDGCSNSIRLHRNERNKSRSDYRGWCRYAINSCATVKELPFFMRVIWDPNDHKNDSLVNWLCKAHQSVADRLF